MTIKKLVFIGAGHAHLQALRAFCAHSSADTDITVISPYEHRVYSSMVPGMVAGHYSAKDYSIHLPSLLAGSRVRLVRSTAAQINAKQRSVLTAHGDTVHYDVLSIDSGAAMDRDILEKTIPGARANALFVHPVEAFAHLLPPFVEMAQGRALRIAVIGAGASGVEMAMALKHRLAHCHISLVSGNQAPLTMYPAGVQRKIAKALRQRNITVLQETCVGIETDCVKFASGSRLSCESALLATGTLAAPWLEGSGLALDTQGFIQINPHLQSTSHPEVFAVGDAATRVDAPRSKNGGFAMRSGRVLTHNLRATLQGQSLKKHTPVNQSLTILSCGNRYAVGCWGPFSWGGGWVWKLKDVIDRRWIRQYKELAPTLETPTSSVP